MNPAPVIIFAYNREEQLKRTLFALKENELFESTKIILYSDGPKNERDAEQVYKIRKWLKQSSHFPKLELVFHEKNMGLANSVISGVTDVLHAYGRSVVLEDDILTSPGFLDYMNRALIHFESYDGVGSISGYSFPDGVFRLPHDYPHQVYFSYRPSSWGWATWLNRWNRVDWDLSNINSFLNDKEQQREFNKGGRDLTRMMVAYCRGEIDSWAIRWAFYHYVNGLKSVYPVKSFVQNIGIGEVATHTQSAVFRRLYVGDLENALKIQTFPDSIVLNEKILSDYQRIYNRSSKYIAVVRHLCNSFFLQLFKKSK